MKIEIRNRFIGKIILCFEHKSIKDCIKKNPRANLYGDNGIRLPIISISGSQHTLQYLSGRIKIGCENHTIDKWLNDYKEIGKNNKYTQSEIKEYGEYIKICVRFANKKN